MDIYHDVETAVLAVLSARFSQTTFELWFQDLHLVSLNDREAVFSINSDFKCTILQTSHAETLKAALKTVNGYEVDEIRVISTDNPSENRPASPSPTPPAANDEEPSEKYSAQIEKEIEEYRSSKSAVARNIEKPTLVSGYTFENFIVGDSNQFAHAACLAVARCTAVYNPLFIYGPSGLGKTHLLYAVTNELKQKHPNIKIVYKTCEEFTNELISSFQNSTTASFREKYRAADVLLIDDIQFIAGKVAVQEEFFHTFNTLYEAEKQIILTSDRPPNEIKPLEDRLCSRFEWGLLADIHSPSFELRCAIIQKKAEEQHITLSQDIIRYLAENLRVNIRQIEGSIKKIAAISVLSSTPVSLKMVEKAISDILSGVEPVSETVDQIIAATARAYGVTPEDIKGVKRNQNIALARHVSIYLIRSMTSLTVSSIGEIFGRDHATILASVRKVEDEINERGALKDAIARIKADLKNSK